MKAKKKKIVRAQEKKVISLALQGGGSHGAMTWGVLDRLLEEKNITIESISATSAGAMNATVFAYGLANSGVNKAKELLETFWKKVSVSVSLSPMQSNFFDRMMGLSKGSVSPMSQAAEMMRHMFSPYQLNFFDINPLEDILKSIVDFEELKAKSKIKLFVNATNLKTGKIKIFNTSDLTPKSLMASACLPYISQAVIIDDERYWDGGFSGNPALSPLIYQSKTADIVIIQVTPFNMDDIPRSVPEIIDRANEISFNTALVKELKGIEIMNDLLTKNKLKDSGSYRIIRTHMIRNEEIMSTLGKSSKMNADWEFLLYLKDLGRQAAEDWIENVYPIVGKRSSYSYSYTQE